MAYYENDSAVRKRKPKSKSEKQAGLRTGEGMGGDHGHPGIGRSGAPADDSGASTAAGGDSSADQ